MRLVVAEWGSIGGLDLTADQIEALASSEAFQLGPDTDSPGRWRISATHRVGVAQLAGLSIKVTPKVPTHRLLELLCSTMERVRWDDRVTTWAYQDDLLATVAASFLAHAEAVLHQGLLQGYRTIDDGMHGIRGRIDIGRQLSRNPGLALPVEVTYDDYTPDILENQLLAGAVRMLLRLSVLPATLVTRLRRLEVHLIGVTPTLGSADPPLVTWTRLNERYRSAVTLARLVLRGASLEFEGHGATSGASFLVDMNQVFEDVVGQGVRAALNPTGHTTYLQREDRLDLHQLISIRPDLRVDLGTEHIAVADVKYKRPGSHGISNGDVYQALAYASRYRLAASTLIYAEEPQHKQLEIGEVTIKLAFLDLNDSPDERAAALAELAEQLARTPLTGRGRTISPR